jgi:3-hydroxyacyl-CoA dehydrogenase
MGAEIAAHLANAGLPVLLLDVTRQAAHDGLARARALKPDPFFTPSVHDLIRTGGFDEDLPGVAGCDWITEAVVERLDIKQALLEHVERHRAPHAIVSTNTSGIPIAAVMDGRSSSSQGARARHTLLQSSPHPAARNHSDRRHRPRRRPDGRGVADRRLGKGVVIAKDTPNFIANHIGLFGVMQIFRALESGQNSIEEIDAMTGPAIGRPKSATFRTMDIAGIDVLAHVAGNLAERLSDDRDRAEFALPRLVETLVSKGWVGAKVGQGFYKREANGDILVLDPATLTYRPLQPMRLPSIEAARAIEDEATRIRTLFLGRDKVGQFLRDTLGRTLVYRPRHAGDCAFDR